MNDMIKNHRRYKDRKSHSTSKFFNQFTFNYDYHSFQGVIWDDEFSNFEKYVYCSNYIKKNSDVSIAEYEHMYNAINMYWLCILIRENLENFLSIFNQIIVDHRTLYENEDCSVISLFKDMNTYNWDIDNPYSSKRNKKYNVIESYIN